MLRRLSLIVSLALILSACASGSTPATGSKVLQLQSVSELRDRFNEDAGKIRLILLVSPT